VAVPTKASGGVNILTVGLLPVLLAVSPVGAVVAVALCAGLGGAKAGAVVVAVGVGVPGATALAVQP